MQGFEHIQLGPDHLLFLIVLVTAFTVGHAISLCLAYFGIVSVPADIIEPLSAVSIVAAAVLALRRKAGEYRW